MTDGCTHPPSRVGAIAAAGLGPGRQQGPRELLVYGGTTCCLCDDALAVLRPLCAELEVKLCYVTIDGDEQLEAAWREHLPVGFLDGRKVFKYHVDVDLLCQRVAALPACT